MKLLCIMFENVGWRDMLETPRREMESGLLMTEYPEYPENKEDSASGFREQGQ